MARKQQGYESLENDCDCKRLLSPIESGLPTPPYRDELKAKLKTALDIRKTTIKEVIGLIREIEESYDKSRKAKIGGTAGTIAGSVIGVAGFGLSFVTFGASIPLMVAGTAISVAGGVTIAGADVGYFNASKERSRSIQYACERDNNNVAQVRETLTKLSGWIDQYCEDHPEISKEQLLSTLNGGRYPKDIRALELLTDGGRILGTISADATKMGTTAARITLESVGVAGKAAGAAAGAVAVAFDAILIPVDVGTMVKAIYDVHKYKGGEGISNSKAAKKARKTLLQLQEHHANMENLYKLILQ